MPRRPGRLRPSLLILGPGQFSGRAKFFADDEKAFSAPRLQPASVPLRRRSRDLRHIAGSSECHAPVQVQLSDAALTVQPYRWRRPSIKWSLPRQRRRLPPARGLGPCGFYSLGTLSFVKCPIIISDRSRRQGRWPVSLPTDAAMSTRNTGALLGCGLAAASDQPVAGPGKEFVSQRGNFGIDFD